MIVTGSRDKSLILWRLAADGESIGQPERRLHGHSHFVSDVTLSSDGQYCLSGSWDGSLRLWDLTTGDTTRRFMSHTKDVLSVAFSVDNRQIVSGSRDKSIKVSVPRVGEEACGARSVLALGDTPNRGISLAVYSSHPPPPLHFRPHPTPPHPQLWNTIGECKLTLDQAHSDWVSAVRFSPSPENPIFVSAGYDKLVKVWSLATFKLRADLVGHTGYLNAVTVSPDGSLCASGGKDGIGMLWDLNEGKRLYSLDAGSIIHALCFSPNRYWLCAATSKCIVIWDLESKAVSAVA